MVNLNRNQQGNYYKSVGFSLNAGRKRVQRKWWLGKDVGKADVIASQIMAAWKQLKAAGASVWTEEAEQEILNLKSSLYDSEPSIAPSNAIASLPEQKSAATSSRQILTLYQAVEHYCTEVIPNLSISQQWKKDLPFRIEAIKDALPDMPLVQIGLTELEQLVQHYTKRPNNKNTGKPIAIETALNYISAARRLFDYLDAHEKWIAPRRFDKAFRVSRDSFELTNREKLKASKGIDVFSVDELARLYANVTHPQQRLWMLLSLNCGFAQAEINSLLVGECILDKDEPYIEMLRGKTQKTIGKWTLWNETITLLNKYLSPGYDFEYKMIDNIIYVKNKSSGTWRTHVGAGVETYEMLQKEKAEHERREKSDTDYVFGGDLVYISGKSRVDNIRSAWVRLLQNTNRVRDLSYKHLRKTGGDMIRKIAGLEAAQCYLAHKGRSVAETRYTNADYERLSDALQILRLQLQPMFDSY